jgi:hypothetical protein
MSFLKDEGLKTSVIEPGTLPRQAVGGRRVSLARARKSSPLPVGGADPTRTTPASMRPSQMGIDRRQRAACASRRPFYLPAGAGNPPSSSERVVLSSPFDAAA